MVTGKKRLGLEGQTVHGLVPDRKRSFLKQFTANVLDIYFQGQTLDISQFAAIYDFSATINDGPVMMALKYVRASNAQIRGLRSLATGRIYTRGKVRLSRF